MSAKIRMMCSGCGREVTEAQELLDAALRSSEHSKDINDQLVEAIAIKAERDWLRSLVQTFAQHGRVDDLVSAVAALRAKP